MTFYDRFSELCAKKGVSASEVAREVGLSNSIVSYWKRGAIPKYETARAIAEYFGVTINFLMGGTDEKKEHLTVEELLAALKQCKNYIGGDSCIGCPNAVPGTEDKDGFCQCRFDTYDEVIRILESLVTNN